MPLLYGWIKELRVDILNLKYIPLKVFVRRKKGKRALKFAWHWSWSITWRWIAEWQFCRTTWGVQKFSNPTNGHWWKHICMGRLGIIRITVQPNMAR